MQSTSASSLSTQSVNNGYDAARWTNWLPKLTHCYALGRMQSVLQSAPVNAFGANETNVPALPLTNVLFFTTKGAPVLDGRICGRPNRRDFKPWDAVLLPSGVDSWWAATPRAVDGVFHLHLDQRLIAALGEENDAETFDMVPHFGFRDDLLIGLAQMVLADLSGPHAPSRLVWDTYASAIALRLRRLNGAQARTQTRNGGLAPFQLRRVTDYIQTHLGSDVALDELAQLVGLSSKHFARAFKQSTGQPPHRWLTNQRIEKAREMLATGDLGIPEIALVCGFADQSHFTAAFRKVLGVTPGSYRRAARL